MNFLDLGESFFFIIIVVTHHSIASVTTLYIE